MDVLEQFRGRVVHHKTYMFGKGDGERDGRNYYEVQVGGKTLDGRAPAAAGGGDDGERRRAGGGRAYEKLSGRNTFAVGDSIAHGF